MLREGLLISPSLIIIVAHSKKSIVSHSKKSFFFSLQWMLCFQTTFGFPGDQKKKEYINPNIHTGFLGIFFVVQANKPNYSRAV